jgi:hypothetical protein
MEKRYLYDTKTVGTIDRKKERENGKKYHLANSNFHQFDLHKTTEGCLKKKVIRPHLTGAQIDF